MRRTWMIPAILVAGVTGLGGLAYAASAQDAGWNDSRGYSRDGGRDEYSGQRWRDDDRRSDEDRGQRWRRGDNDCGPRGRGWGRGEHGGRHYGRGYDRDDGPREGRGYGWREGRRFDRDDSDRGYRRHGYHHRHEGRGGPRRFGQGFDPARLDSVKRELSVTAAQEQAWTKYTATLKEVADARKARRESIDRDAVRKMSPDDLRKFRDGMIDQRRKEQDRVRSAAEDLVKSLDEKQVAIAKEVLPGYAFGPGMRMGMGMGMGMGGGRNR